MPAALVDYFSPDVLILGRQVVDQVALGNLTIPQQSMSVALLSEGFDTVDGILGCVSAVKPSLSSSEL